MRTYFLVALLLVTALPARGETITALNQAYTGPGSASLLCRPLSNDKARCVHAVQRPML